jgi:RND family efflux transporter MFP subunit
MRAKARLNLIALCFLGCSAKGEAKEPAAAKKSVRCVEVKSVQLGESVELRGTIAPLPDRDAEIAAQVAGRILHVLVREGDRVHAGQVLARIDAAPLLDQVHEADAAQARVRAERANAETTLARIERVFEHGIAARQEVDDATARLASARASEAEARAAAQRVHLQLERAAVQSPLEGVVLKLLRRSGEAVDGTQATPIVEVGDPSQLELVADAPAQDIVRLERDASATVVVSALAGLTFQGHVAAVAPAVDRTTGLGVVRVALELSQTTAPPVGAYGSARVQTGRMRAALVLPAAALRATGNDAEVLICGADALAHARKVRTLPTNAGLVEITSGLDAGERVVLEPMLGISDGDALQVMPP